MISFNPQVNELMRAYNESSGQECPLMAHFERCWLEMLNHGVTPDDVKLVIKGRIKANMEQPNCRYSTKLIKLIDGDANQANFMNELAEIRASLRKPKHSPGKVTVLVDTGRSGEIEQPDARSMATLLDNLKRSAG